MTPEQLQEAANQFPSSYGRHSEVGALGRKRWPVNDTPHRYQKRPLIIEAVQWTGDNLTVMQKFVGHVPPNTPGCADGHPGFVYLNATGVGRLYVAANEDWVKVWLNDWVGKDPAGCYPITNEIFAQTYDLVEG